MDNLWIYAGMTRAHGFNFQNLPEIIDGDTLIGTPTITYQPNDGNLAITGINLGTGKSLNKVLANYTPAPPAAGLTYTVTCTVQTQRGETLKMVGQLQVF